MISLDAQIKKDKQSDKRYTNNRRQSRERSRDRYRSRDNKWRTDRDEQGGNDYSRKSNYSNKNYNSSNSYRQNNNYHSNSHHLNSHHSNSHHSNKNNNKQEKAAVKFSQLHYSVTKQQLKEICEKYGDVKFCKIFWDKMGRSKQTAIVGYFNSQNAQTAAKQLNQMKFQDTPVSTQVCFSQKNDQKSNDFQWNSKDKNTQY